jgi:hypothetical protein
MATYPLYHAYTPAGCKRLWVKAASQSRFSISGLKTDRHLGRSNFRHT